MQEILKQTPQESTTIHPIPVSSIIPNPNQPRKEFHHDSILKLADSIKQFGIIQPLTVRKIGDTYELVSGERRLRAAKELNMPFVPCLITNIDEEKSAEISIIENLIREDLNIFEQALAIETLIDSYGLTQEQVARKLSNSQSYIANKLRLLRLSAEERELIIQNKLTERHARALLRVFDEHKRKELLSFVVENGLNVSNTEILVTNFLNGINEKAAVTETEDNREKSSQTSQAEATISDEEHQSTHSTHLNTPSEDVETAEISTKVQHTYKDTGSFYNAINRALDCAKSSNLEIKSRKIVGDSFTEITIIIPNKAQSEQSESS